MTQPTRSALPPSPELLGGRYQRIAHQGGVGELTPWRAYDWHERGWRTVLVLDEGSDTAAGQALQDTARKQALSHGHPNVARVLHMGGDNQQTWLVTPVAEGGTLASWLAKHGPMPRKLAVAVILQVCSGVVEMQARGHLNPELCPGNVFVDHHGLCLVAGFGRSERGPIDEVSRLLRWLLRGHCPDDDGLLADPFSVVLQRAGSVSILQRALETALDRIDPDPVDTPPLGWLLDRQHAEAPPPLRWYWPAPPPAFTVTDRRLLPADVVGIGLVGVVPLAAVAIGFGELGLPVLFVAVVLLLVAAAVRSAQVGTTVVTIYEGRMTLIYRGKRCVVALEDVVEVATGRRRFHSEFVVVPRDGNPVAVPVWGHRRADAIAAAIRAASTGQPLGQQQSALGDG